MLLLGTDMLVMKLELEHNAPHTFVVLLKQTFKQLSEQPQDFENSQNGPSSFCDGCASGALVHKADLELKTTKTQTTAQTDHFMPFQLLNC